MARRSYPRVLTAGQAVEVLTAQIGATRRQEPAADGPVGPDLACVPGRGAGSRRLAWRPGELKDRSVSGLVPVRGDAGE